MGEWHEVPLETIDKVRMAGEHWRTGASWEAVGAVDFLVANVADLHDRDGYRTIDDVGRRFERLDAMFDTMRSEPRLRTRSELPGRSLRTPWLVAAHRRRWAAGLGGGGCHRLAAQVLGCR